MKRIKVNIIIPPSHFATPFRGISFSILDSRKTKRCLVFPRVMPHPTPSPPKKRKEERDEQIPLLYHCLVKSEISHKFIAPTPTCPAVGICTHLEMAEADERSS